MLDEIVFNRSRLYRAIGLAMPMLLQGCPQEVLPPEAFSSTDVLETKINRERGDGVLYDLVEGQTQQGDVLFEAEVRGIKEEVVPVVDTLRAQDITQDINPEITQDIIPEVTADIQADSEAFDSVVNPIKPYVKDEHCVALFHFESGNEFDDSCNGLKLNNYNTSEAGSLKEFGKARMFDGKAYLELPDAALLKVKSGLTLEAMVKPQIMGKSYEGKYGTVVTKEDFYEGYFLKIEEGKVTGGAALSDGKIHMVSSAYVLPLDTFTHLAFTYDGAKMKLYIEQKIVAEELAQGTIVYKTNKSVFMGLNAYENGFEGAIDEVRISDVAREF